MNNQFVGEEELKRMFTHDARGIEPDTAVQERLEYAFLLNRSSYKTTQNSFLSLFSSLFSWSHLPAKVAVVSLLLMVSLINFQPKSQQFIMPGSDTTLNSVPLRIDTSGMLPFFGDTCVNVKS
ncbi:hypothetical protein [Maribellus mangrovi]|uniref:hypothetical protein n=1 Tax=Maribellus mangrovi TaxID=3133146 RepID=UPI0030EB3A30